MFCFPGEGLRELAPLSFHKLSVHMHGNNKTKFERNGSQENYHIAYTGN